MVEIIKGESFLRKLSKLDKSYLDKLEKLTIKIANEPEIGKSMRFDRRGTREIYMSPFRISYFYSKDEDTIYFLDICHKDEQ